MTKNIFKILAVFIIGTVGGIFADQIFWPYFIERPLFYKYKLDQTPIYLTERKEITNYIQENTALKDVSGRVSKAVVGIKAKIGEDQIIKGSGLVATNDGFLVTFANLLPQGSEFAFYVDARWPEYQILKRDLRNNLALVKVDGRGFSTAGFADMGKTKLGERVFLAGFNFSSTTPELMINEGIIKFFSEDSIQTNILETAAINGSPLFNIEGEVLGLSFIDEQGRVFAVPISKIRQFIGF